MRRLSLFSFIIILVGLAACSAPPDLTPTPTSPPATASDSIETVALEPTNTPLPPATEIPVGEECSTSWQQQFIDEAFVAYQANRADGAESVAELTDWLSDVSADLAVACNPSVTETTDPEQLADLLIKLQDGGYVIYVRHTHTDRSRGDDDVSFGQCDQQRILSDRGRNEALFIRNAYKQLNLPVSRLISTQYCRTLETAVLAFGVPELVLRSDLSDSLPDYLAAEPEAGTNVMIVAHIGTIRNAIGLDDTFEEGDSLVYRPVGDGGFDYVGRIGLYDWPILAELNAN
ncbi:MAG: hypothetical protein AB8G95_13210 [Anaerolineae bacterium]